MPRANSINIVNIAGVACYEFTALGITELRQLATVGTPVAEIAKYFGVSDDWVRKQLLTDIAVMEAHGQAEADGRYELRKALHEAAIGGDARVLTFMGERALGMIKKVEHEHNHRVAVIGTMPAEKLESKDWFSQFAPKDVTAQLEHVPSAAAADEDGVEDAEIIE